MKPTAMNLVGQIVVGGLALMALLATASPQAFAAPGSWVGDADSVRLFTPGRAVESTLLTPPPELADGAHIRTLRWRFTAPSGPLRPEAWLCHPRRCIMLSTPSGQSQALAGLSADAPLTFRFRLPASARSTQPLRIEGLQVIVDYD
ncbi:flagellar protein FlhE [Modicisalibacter muralis]|uniref:Flagellar protein FlhE n=1 Tax=Modicisalibacter muralis TaxID=119000 RepID=A0A1G9G0U7_9GAMM|nr:flagellar protein FlhE [Halomonas muralis]SDK94187.1 flagellar protein FlhE [Halomonas muralis]